MKLYHWEAEGVHLMVVATDEGAARTAMVDSIREWRWQNPERFDAIVDVIQNQAPRYVADPGHVITIDLRDKQPDLA